MDVVTQWVRTAWTKRSRGGPAATVRNATPIAFVLPATTCPAVHEILMDEQHDFVPSAVFEPREPPHAGVRLTERDGRLRVEVPLAFNGLPPRPSRPPAVWLDRGQWLRWQLNYRFSWPLIRRGEWSYRLDTLNLAYAPTGRAVFTGTPDHHVDERAHLR